MTINECGDGMTLVRRTTALLAVLALLGCAGAKEAVVSPMADALAREFIDSLRASAAPSSAGLVHALSPRVSAIPGVGDSLAHVASALPAGPVDTFELVGAGISERAGVRRDSGAYLAIRRRMTYRLHAMAGWAIVQVVVLDEPGHPSIDGISVHPLADSTVARGRLPWKGAAPAGIIASVAAIGLAIFCVVTAVIIARTPMPRRWLWTAIPLVGVGSYAIPWSGGRGGWGTTLQLFAAGSRRFDLDGPMYILLAFPLGALLALGRRDELLARGGRPTRGLAASIAWSPLRGLARVVVPRMNARTIPLEARIWIAVAQIAGGLAGIGLIVSERVTGPGRWEYSTTLFLILCALSIAAGVLLWRGVQAGLALSRVLLAMQVVKVYTESIVFGLALVPQLAIAWTTEDHDVIVGLPDFEWRLGADASANQGFVINVLAIVLLILLFVRWPPRPVAAAAPATVAPPSLAEVVRPEPATGEVSSAQPRMDATQ